MNPLDYFRGVKEFYNLSDCEFIELLKEYGLYDDECRDYLNERGLDVDDIYE